jgi:hypothetical protein
LDVVICLSYNKRVSIAIQMTEGIRLPYEMPYYAQLASPDWLSRVFDDGGDPTGDPNWEAFGTTDADEYRYWAPRSCGIACVKMVVEALGGLPRPMMEWVKQGIDREGYRIRSEADGSIKELGWSHTVLAALISAAGFPARSAQTQPAGIICALRRGMPVIVSITFELGTNRPIAQNSGHLGVITGSDLESDQLQAVYIHNPSGRTEALRKYARIPADRFTEGYSGRAILID